MGKIKELILRNKAIIAYMFFGVCTTLINWLSYYICYNAFCIPNVFSTIIAWFLAIVFAFITNKKWVFGSESFKAKTLAVEAVAFFLSRIATGILDVVIMWIAVDVNGLSSNVWKFISNIIIIIINYVLSKLIVFKKRES